MKLKNVLCVVFLCMILTGHVLAQSQYYPGSTDKWHYYVAGQRRTLLQWTLWGGVFYITDKMGSMEFSQGLPNGTSKITSPAGEVNIDNNIDSIEIAYPGGKASARQSLNDLTVAFKGGTYTFTAQQNECRMTVPGDTITFTDSLNDMTISGKRGTVLYKEENVDEYSITSQAGKTVYKKTLQGFKFSGVPMSSHPYQYWCVEFTISGVFVGFMVDLRQFSLVRKYSDLFQWDKTLLVQ